MRQSIESIILTIMQMNYAVQRGAKIEKNPAFDPLVKGRKIGDYLDAATRMYALINQSGAMLSCCHASPFVAPFYALRVLSRHEHDRIGFNG